MVCVALALAAVIVMLLTSGSSGFLGISFFLGIWYPLLVAIPWVMFTAILSWLMRLRSPWWSLAMGGCASVFIAGLALWPIWTAAIRSGAGISGRDAPGLVLTIAAIVVVSAVQLLVHIVIRARRRGEVTPELG
jgi:hypothetical protein